jgi:hypothetical protein
MDEDVTDSYDEAEADDTASGWDAALGHIEEEPSEASSSQAQAAPSNLPADYYEEDATGSITGLPPRIMAKSATVVREIVGKELQDFLDREAEANYVEPVFTGRELTDEQQTAMVARQDEYHAFKMVRIEQMKLIPCTDALPPPPSQQRCYFPPSTSCRTPSITPCIHPFAPRLTRTTCPLCPSTGEAAAAGARAP